MLAAWFLAHPRSGLYARQIDVAGVHTKLIAHGNALAHPWQRKVPSISRPQDALARVPRNGFEGPLSGCPNKRGLGRAARPSGLGIPRGKAQGEEQRVLGRRAGAPIIARAPSNFPEPEAPVEPERGAIALRDLEKEPLRLGAGGTTKG